MKNQLALVASYAVIYAAFHAWTDNTGRGRALKHFLQHWKTDWVHGVMVSVSVFILFSCGIVALALTGQLLGF